MQAPSDYPDMAEFPVRLGVDSMSLNLDTVIKTTRHVLEVENQFVPAQCGATGAIGRQPDPHGSESDAASPRSTDRRRRDHSRT